MPWASKKKSLSAVRGCFGSAGKDPKKKKKCRRMAHEAKVWRKGKSMRKGGRKT